MIYVVIAIVNKIPLNNKIQAINILPCENSWNKTIRSLDDGCLVFPDVFVSLRYTMIILYFFFLLCKIDA